MKSLCLGIAMLLAVSLPAVGPVESAGAADGIWSKLSHPIPRGRSFRVPSPDRKKTVYIEELALIVIEGGAPLSGIEGYTLLLPAEIQWAPDSKAFFITSNEGGIGEEAWFVTVYVLESDRVNYYEVTSEAFGRFIELVKCPDAGDLQFGAIKWIKESKNLLVVAEVPEKASCTERGTFRGYVVEVPTGKVLSEHDPKKLADRWGEYLGPRFSRKTSP